MSGRVPELERRDPVDSIIYAYTQGLHAGNAALAVPVRALAEGWIRRAGQLDVPLPDAATEERADAARRHLTACANDLLKILAAVCVPPTNTEES